MTGGGQAEGGPSIWQRLRAFARRIVTRHKPSTGDADGGVDPAPSLPRDEAVAERRAAMAAAGFVLDKVPERALGLAFSGGGIRSATISLGAAQALAHRERLLDFDYLSTVSGGGYIGSFLGTLFLPGRHRGLEDCADEKSDGKALLEQHDFAMAALTRKAFERRIDPPGEGEQVRSPVWWLREHGRYLAPNGATDYATSAAYLVRNWLAMLYVVALPLALIFLATTGIGRAAHGVATPVAGVPVGEWVANAIHGRLPPAFAEEPGPRPPAPAYPAVALHWPQAPAGVDVRITQADPAPPAAGGRLWSPILLLVPLFLFLGLAAGISYWLTAWQPMVQVGTARVSPQVRFMLGAGTFLILSATGLALVAGSGLPEWPLRLAFLALAMTATAAVVALAAGIAEWRQADGAFVMSLRRRLTAIAAGAGRWMLLLLLLGLIDTAALALVARVDVLGLPAATGLLLPAGAWLIGKLPQWFGGDGRATRWLVAHGAVVALVAGCALFAGFAVLVDALLQSVLWTAAPWSPGAAAWSWTLALGMLAVLGVLVLVTGFSDGFINLSSLHNLYAARLTRAYLGASNLQRLKVEGAGIKRSQSCDDLPIDRYATTRTCAPIHLVNVTLNETRSRDGSNLTDRDRKGVPVVFAPEGILIDAARPQTANVVGWDEAHAAGIERLTVGQLCAISGAAASSGMGARTTLGTAVALTFANIRLGYWWRVDTLVKGKGAGWWWPIARCGRTFFYLWNELLSRYSREYPRLYLSDGGHFENSGAYELLRRKVGTLLVYDNGEDPKFRFEDLENLVRKARLDLGLSINVCSDEAVRRLLGRAAAPFFLNCPGAADDRFGDDWRARAAAPGTDAVALLLCAYDADGAGTAHGVPRPCHYIVWMKPRLSAVLPQDVRGYGLANAGFPHQSTGDQFFDEAQWESYRALGEAMTKSLLGTEHAGKDILRRLAARLAAMPR